MDEIAVNSAHNKVCTCKDVFLPGLHPSLDLSQGFYVKFACSPWVSVGLLQVSPTVEKHTNWLNWMPPGVCVCVCPVVD